MPLATNETRTTAGGIRFSCEGSPVFQGRPIVLTGGDEWCQRVENLTKVYSMKQAPAVDSVSFEVANGEIVGFVGLNGAGKTTTIRVAAGIALPTSGTVKVNGHDVVEQKVNASRQLGWVPELPNFESNAKAGSLMHYFAGFYGIGAREADTKTAELLKLVGLAGFETRKLRSYSQGMKKRFSLAASMLSDPPNYLFDEVLNGLDLKGSTTSGSSCSSSGGRERPCSSRPTY